MLEQLRPVKTWDRNNMIRCKRWSREANYRGRLMPTFKDRTIDTGETRRIHICYQCDPEQYPKGKPIDSSTDWMARKDEKGNWICGDCQIEDLNKRKICVLGKDHPDSKFIIELEDKNVKAYNNYAKRWNEMVGAELKYRKNKYTGKIPF